MVPFRLPKLIVSPPKEVATASRKVHLVMVQVPSPSSDNELTTIGVRVDIKLPPFKGLRVV